MLLIEDDRDDAELVLTGLRRAGMTQSIEWVADGAAALDYLFRRGAYAGRTTSDPVLVLLDLKMPKVDGFEVLRQLKGAATLRRIPTVVFTSSSEPADLRMGYELGANAYVVKPVDFADLVATVGSIGRFWMAINRPPPA
jgi:CheY-like chemotaxis protein